IQARTIAPEMSKILGQPVVVENKAGGNAVIGFEYVAKQSAPDGYTILIANMPNQALMPLTVNDLRFDPIKDLPPLVGVAEQRLLIGSSTKMPWKSMQEMVAYNRANPGKLNYGSPSILTGLVIRGLVQDLKLEGTFIPYPTTAAYNADV